MVLKTINRDTHSSQNVDTMDSIVEGHEENDKFIPFLGGIDKTGILPPDRRIAYFVSKLRKASTAQKGADREYKHTSELVHIIHTAAIQFDIFNIDAKETNIVELGRGINKQGGLIPNQRYKMKSVGNIGWKKEVPTVMSLNSNNPLSSDWKEFYCDMFHRIAGKKITLVEGSIDFIKRVIPALEKRNIPEYKFAVAFIQTFLRELTMIDKNKPIDILFQPHLWEHANRGWYHSSSVIIKRLFPPYKAYTIDVIFPGKARVGTGSYDAAGAVSMPESSLSFGPVETHSLPRDGDGDEEEGDDTLSDVSEDSDEDMDTSAEDEYNRKRYNATVKAAEKFYYPNDTEILPEIDRLKKETVTPEAGKSETLYNILEKGFIAKYRGIAPEADEDEIATYVNTQMKEYAIKTLMEKHAREHGQKYILHGGAHLKTFDWGKKENIDIAFSNLTQVNESMIEYLQPIIHGTMPDETMPDDKLIFSFSDKRGKEMRRVLLDYINNLLPFQTEITKVRLSQSGDVKPIAKAKAQAQDTFKLPITPYAKDDKGEDIRIFSIKDVNSALFEVSQNLTVLVGKLKDHLSNFSRIDKVGVVVFMTISNEIKALNTVIQKAKRTVNKIMKASENDTPASEGKPKPKSRKPPHVLNKKIRADGKDEFFMNPKTSEHMQEYMLNFEKVNSGLSEEQLKAEFSAELGRFSESEISAAKLKELANVKYASAKLAAKAETKDVATAVAEVVAESAKTGSELTKAAEGDAAPGGESAKGDEAPEGEKVTPSDKAEAQAIGKELVEELVKKAVSGDPGGSGNAEAAVEILRKTGPVIDVKVTPHDDDESTRKMVTRQANTTEMYNNLIQLCKGHSQTEKRSFDTLNYKRFIEKRAQLYIAGAHEEAEKLLSSTDTTEDTEDADSLEDVVNQLTDSPSGHIYTYENKQGILYITDTTTGVTTPAKQIKPNLDKLCNYAGVKNGKVACDNFFANCLDGTNNISCKTFLTDRNFWIPKTGLAHFLKNVNLYIASLHLKKYGFKILSDPTSHLRKFNSVKEWLETLRHDFDFADLEIGRIRENEPLIAILEGTIKAINERPAILNVTYTGSPIKSQPEEQTIDILIRENKGLPDTSRKLPSKLKIAIDNSIEKTEAHWDLLLKRMEKKVEQMFKDNNMLKKQVASIGTQTETKTKYKSYQRGGADQDDEEGYGSKPDMKIFDNFSVENHTNYNVMKDIKDMIYEPNMGMSTNFSNIINQYKELLLKHDKQLADTNIIQIDKSVKSIRNKELTILKIALYVYNYLIFFHTELKDGILYLKSGDNNKDQAIRDLIDSNKLTIEQLIEMVHVAQNKLKKYCAKDKNDKLVKVCQHLEILTKKLTSE